MSDAKSDWSRSFKRFLAVLAACAVLCAAFTASYALGRSNERRAYREAALQQLDGYGCCFGGKAFLRLDRLTYVFPVLVTAEGKDCEDPLFARECFE